MPIIDIHDLVTNHRKSQKLHFEIVTYVWSFLKILCFKVLLTGVLFGLKLCQNMKNKNVMETFYHNISVFSLKKAKFEKRFLKTFCHFGLYF